MIGTHFPDPHFPDPHNAPGHDPNHALCALRHASSEGRIRTVTPFQPGLSLQADPDLMVDGEFRSPAGRLLELDVTTAGTGSWIALHIRLVDPDLSDCAYLGFACRHAAPGELAIQPCLRSGTADGFSDCFFTKHILSVPEPLNHVDALHIPTRRAISETAPWRELVLFLPRHDFRWDLHDLRLFAI